MRHSRLSTLFFVALFATACSGGDPGDGGAFALTGVGPELEVVTDEEAETYTVASTLGDAGPRRTRCRGGESDNRCAPDEVCCPTTMFCVPRDCPQCCATDAFHRFETFETPDNELPREGFTAPPDVPGDDDRSAPDRSPLGRGTPGPMPNGPSTGGLPPLPVTGPAEPGDGEGAPEPRR